MAANKIVRMGPAWIVASATNIVNPPTLTGGTGLQGTNTNTYLVIRHIRIVNTSGSPTTVSMYIGATGGSAAGTQFLGTAISVAANSAYDWYGMLRLDPVDFLTGLCAAGATTCTFEAEGEIGVV